MLRLWRIGLGLAVVAAGFVGATGSVSAASNPCFPNVTGDATATAGRLSLIASVVEGVLDSALRSDLSAGSTRTLTVTFAGVPAQLVETRNVDGSVTAELDMLGSVGAGPTTIWTGTASQSLDAAAGISTTGYQATLDFSALHSVIGGEAATGLMQWTSSVIHDPSKPAPGVKKTQNVNFTNFLPEAGDPHGPRTGSYTHVGEPGVGGSLQFNDSLVLICPFNPGSLVSSTRSVQRWFSDQGGGIHGRSDSKADGGQIPDGFSFVSLACVTTAPTFMTFTFNKEENSAGDTIASSSSGAPSGPCSPLFGPVPSLSNNGSDYDFAQPATFPGEW
jgi:hypothetical protein